MRDPETYDANGQTALDWFNVRHMSGAQGRFQSPDPGNAGADLANPQTWNGYAYVGNNPLSYIDPSGEFATGFFTPAGESSAAWSFLGPGAAAAFILYEAFFDNGPASHPLPTQPAGQGVTNPGSFGFSIPGSDKNNAKMFTSSSSPKCGDVSEDQGQQIIKNAEDFLNTPYNLGHMVCTTLVCTSVGRTMNWSPAQFPEGPADVWGNHTGLRPLKPSEPSQTGDIIRFRVHVGLIDPAKRPGQVLSATVHGVRWTPYQPYGVYFGEPLGLSRVTSCR